MRTVRTNLFVIFMMCVVSCGGDSAATTSSKDIPKDSPVGVLRTFTEAKKAKDVEMMKRTLSEATIKTIAGVAEEGYGQTVDEYLLPGNTTPLNRPEMPLVRNEQVGQETATVEISRFPGDKWRKLTFVREDAAWKMDLNLYMNELYPGRQVDPSKQAPPPPSSK